MGKEQGVVKWFNADKGYGFITPDAQGADVFVHIRDIEKSGLRALQEGQRVSYETSIDAKSKKPKAQNISVL